MPTFEFLQPRFTEGVLSKSLHGQSSEEFYHYGLYDAENMIPLIEGPMVKRPGTLYVSESKTAASRLIPFFKGGTDAYVLEIGYDETATDDTFTCTFNTTSTTENQVTASVANVAKLSVGQHLWQDTEGSGWCIASRTAYPSLDTSTTIVSIDSTTQFTISENATAAHAVSCTFSNKPFIRFFSQDKLLDKEGAAGTPYIIKSHRWFTSLTNSINEIESLSWTQSGDVLFFTCPTRKPFLLARTIETTGVRAEDNSVWTIQDYVQEDGPYENTNADPDKAIVALESQNTTYEKDDEIAFVQFDPTNNVVVLANHGLQVGQKINLKVLAPAGVFKNTQIIVKNGIVDPGDGGDPCLGGHVPAYHTGSPGTHVENNYFYVVYATSVAFQISDIPNGPAWDIGYINKDAATTPTPGDQFTGEVKLYRRIYERDSTVILDSKYRYGTNPDTWATSHATSTNDGFGGELFSNDDIGRLIRINPIADTTTRRGGIRWAWGKITAASSVSRIQVKLETDCSVYADDGYDPVGPSVAGLAAGSSEWRLGSFSGYWDYTSLSSGMLAFTGNGYPKISQIYQQRLCFATTQVEPSTVWLSRTGNFYNFAPTELGLQDSPLVLTSGVTTEVISASNGLYFTIDSDTLDEILWLLDSKRLALGTSAGVYMLYGSETNLTVTPTRFTINRETSYSATNVEPVVVSNVIIYPQRGGREIQELEFSGSEDQWLQSRISMKAYDMISTSSITKLVWQERPNPIIWMIMDNGKVLSLSYDRQVKFKAWSTHSIGGTDAKVTDIAIIPKTDYDQVWFQVTRTIDNSTKSYVEYLTRFPSENVTTRNELVFLDSAKIHKAVDLLVDSSGDPETPLVNTASQTGITLTVDGATSVPAVGTRFVIMKADGTASADTTIHEIAATPASTTTSWKLTQALASSPEDDAVIEFRLEDLTVAHLEGESIGLCTNGMEHVNKTVSASYIASLNHQLATTAISGMFYSASMTTLSPPTLDNQYNWNKRLLTLTALIQESLGIRIEYNELTEELLFRSTQQNTGEPIALFTGFRKQTLSGIGWNTHNVKVNSVSPLPMQINAIAIELETGGA